MPDSVMRILFLEDDPEYAQLIKRMVEQYISLPHQLLHADTLKQAFALLDENKFDVGLIDLHLPDSSGLETLVRLRSKAPQLPIVVLTGQKEEDYARRALDAGAQDFLLKEEVLPRLLTRVLKYAIERKQSEKALKESEHRQKVILESAQVGILVIEPRSHTIVEANPAALRMVGKNRNEVVGSICHEVICPAEIGECPITDLHQTLDKSEREMVTAQGKRVPILKTANTVILGGKEHLLETFLDITEIKQAKEFLKKSREHLENEVQKRTKDLENAKKQWEDTFDAVPDFISIIGRDYRILRVNKSLAARRGVEGKDLIGSYCWEALRGQKCPLDECPQTKVLEHGNSQILEVWSSVLQAHLLVSISPLRDSAGNIYASVHVARDISDVKQAEAKLKEQLDFVQRIVETVPNPIFVKNKQGVFTGCNQALCDFWGLEREEIVGKRLHDYLPETLADLHQAMDVQVLEKKGGLSYEAQAWAGGEPRDAIIYKAPFFDSQGVPAGIVGVIVDITERKRIEEQLLKSQKLEAIGQLAAGIAHEINTPTQFIHTNQEFLDETFGTIITLLSQSASLMEEIKSQAADQDDILRRASEILAGIDLACMREDILEALSGTMEGVERITKIVESMRYFAHPGTEKKVSIDVNDALEHAITVSRNEWKYYADVETDLSPAIPILLGYSAPFNQALLNVIINAAQAISEKLGQSPEEKGLISISTRQERGWVEIRISDTGCGIPDEVLPKIFDPFFTTKKVGKGTGQGLPLAQNVIVEKHGGSIEVETELGKGTVFVMRLPSAD